MTTPGDGPGTLRAHLDAAVASAGFQLTKDNVLFFRDAIVNEANRIRTDLNLHRHVATYIPLLGGDPVSYDASRAFPVKLESLMKEVEQFATDLDAAARALDETARRYGIAEDDIMHNFSHAEPTATAPQLDDAARGSGVGELVSELTTGPPPGGVGLPLDHILNPHLYGGS